MIRKRQTLLQYYYLTSSFDVIVFNSNYFYIYRSSHPEVFHKIGVFKISTKFTAEKPGSFFNKVAKTPVRVFYCKSSESFTVEHL